MAEFAFIYTLADKRTGEIRYVGKTFDLKQRLYDHTHYGKDKPRTKNSCWVESLKRDGFWPVIEELERFPAENEPEWMEGESFWIETLRFYGCNLNNLCSGGGSGRRHSKSTLQKIAISRIGFTHTPESKAKISISCKARMTEEEKERLRVKCSTFRHTEEMKRYISKVKIGIPKPAHVKAALHAGHAKWRIENGHTKKPKIFQKDKVILHLVKAGFVVNCEGIKFVKGKSATASVVKCWATCECGTKLTSEHTMTQLQRGLVVLNGIITPK